MQPSPQDTLLNDLTAMENRVWQALVEGDAQADAALLSKDFLGVYPDGFAGKTDHSGQLKEGPTVAHFTLSELRARAFGPSHALLSYRASFQRMGADAPEEVMFVTSVWQRAGASWINIFSQDTPALQGM